MSGRFTQVLLKYIFFRVNDQLLRVNNNDVSNVDKKFAIGAMRSRSGIVNLVIITIVIGDRVRIIDIKLIQ